MHAAAVFIGRACVCSGLLYYVRSCVLKRKTSFSNNSLTLDNASVILHDFLRSYLRIQLMNKSVFQGLERFVSSAIKCLFVKFFFFLRKCVYICSMKTKTDEFLFLV